MLEMKITITAPDLAAAIVSLASAIEGKKLPSPQPVVTTSIPTSTPSPVQVASTASAQTAPAAPIVPISAPTYTRDMLAVAGATLVDAGKQTELVALLAKYGANSLPELAVEHYGAFATELRAMGARL